MRACDSAELAQLTARMMAEGGLLWTDQREIDFAELRGERVRFGANHEDVSFGFTALPEDLEAGLVILSRTIQYPLLDAESFDKMRLAELEAQRSRVSRESLMFKLAATAALNENVGGRLVPADFARIKSATVADVRRCYKELLDPKKSVVVVVGDASWARAKDAVEKHFAKWIHSHEPATAKLLTAAWRDYATVSFIPTREGPQTDLMLLQGRDLFQCSVPILVRTLRWFLGSCGAGRLRGASAPARKFRELLYQPAARVDRATSSRTVLPCGLAILCTRAAAGQHSRSSFRNFRRCRQYFGNGLKLQDNSALSVERVDWYP